MLIWPFPTKNTAQYRRIDQGWDLQTKVGDPIFAIASGVISYAHNAAGFGDPYPVLTFDQPIDGNPACYYGHNHPEIAQGGHVNQGQVIAHTLQFPGGNARGLPGWLEIGWWHNGPTGNGQSMHDHLINASVFSPAQPGGPKVPSGYDFVTTMSHFVDWTEVDGHSWILTADGAVYASPSANHVKSNVQGVNGKPYWVNVPHTAAKIHVRLEGDVYVNCIEDKDGNLFRDDGGPDFRTH